MTSSILGILTLVCLKCIANSSVLAEYSDPKNPWSDNMNKELLGRSSQFYNLVPLNAQVQATDLINLADAEAALNTALTALQSQVNSLVAAAVPKCPDTAPAGSSMVGSYCYYVRTAQDSFIRAQSWCVGYGGTLAQPLPQNSFSFYNSIATAFANPVATIGVLGEVWIGLFQKSSSPTAPFTYLSNNVQVPIAPTNLAFSSLPATATNQNAAVLVFPGTPGQWKFYDITTADPQKSSICQFTAVL